MDYAKEFENEPDYIKSKKLDADWYIEKTGSVIRIRFEGTKSFKDFLVDMVFFPITAKLFKGCKLKFHKGFKDAYWSIRSELLDRCYELYSFGDAFLIEGHSLGGAMAVICAEDIQYHFNTKPTLITWGCPRACANDKTLKVIYDCINLSDSRFFKNGSDLVTCLPPWNAKPEYTLLGEPFNFWKGLLDMIKGKFKYHCGYGDSEIYGNDKLGRVSIKTKD